MSVQNPHMARLAGRAPSENALNTALRTAMRRIRLLRLLRNGSTGLCAGAILCLILAGLGKLSQPLTPMPWLLALLLMVSVLAGAAYALLLPLTDLDVARVTESRADLKERLSSAVEFQQLGASSDSPFYGEQLRDANRHAAELDVKALYPTRVPRTLPAGIL